MQLRAISFSDLCESYTQNHLTLVESSSPWRYPVSDQHPNSDYGAEHHSRFDETVDHTGYTVYGWCRRRCLRQAIEIPLFCPEIGNYSIFTIDSIELTGIIWFPHRLSIIQNLFELTLTRSPPSLLRSQNLECSTCATTGVSCVRSMEVGPARRRAAPESWSSSCGRRPP